MKFLWPLVGSCVLCLVFMWLVLLLRGTMQVTLLKISMGGMVFFGLSMAVCMWIFVKKNTSE